MKRYNSDSDVLERNNKSGYINLACTVIAFFAFFYVLTQYFNLSDWEKDETGSSLIMGMIITAGFAVWGIVDIRKNALIDGCLKSNYLIVEPNKVSGMFCKSLSDPNDTQFFSLTPDEIENAESVQATKTNPYTLYIHTKHGTYKLCIENAADAVRKINDCGHLEVDIRNQLYKHEWACSLCGKMIDKYPCKYCNAGSDEN